MDKRQPPKTSAPKSDKRPGKYCSKTNPTCHYEVNVNDPHDRCLRHNTTCFTNFLFDPTHCAPCITLFEAAQAKDRAAAALFQERITAMKRSIACGTMCKFL